jgi:hypothetical protein
MRTSKRQQYICAIQLDLVISTTRHPDFSQARSASKHPSTQAKQPSQASVPHKLRHPRPIYMRQNVPAVGESLEQLCVSANLCREISFQILSTNIKGLLHHEVGIRVFHESHQYTVRTPVLPLRCVVVRGFDQLHHDAVGLFLRRTRQTLFHQVRT